MSAASQLVQALERDGVEVGTQTGIPMACPANETAVVAVLERAARDGLRVVPIGLGTRLAFSRPEVLEGTGDLLLSTRRLDAVVAYEPGDGTLTAQAGARLSDLADRVRDGGHRLTPDVPRPSEATLGGVLAAGCSGLDRGRFGPARHHVLGTRVALSDGTLAKSGGRLVKNVTGFDLHRLWCGSRGTLCVILEASLRLFPEPEQDLACEMHFDDVRQPLELGRELACGAARVGHAPIRPLTTLVAAVVEGPRDDGRFALHLFLAGRAAATNADRERITALLERPTFLEGEDARSQACLVRDAAAPDGRFGPFRVTSLPTQIAGAVETTQSFLDARGIQHRAQVNPAIALADFHLGDGCPDSEALAELLVDLAERLSPAEANLEARAVPAAVQARLTPPMNAAAELWTRRLAERFDPKGMFRSPHFPLPA